MATNRIKLPGASGNRNAPVKDWSAAEMGLWRYADPYVADRSGIWIDASSDWLYRNGGPSDDPAGYALIDRLGDRIFTSGIGARHPITVRDTATGKPCLLFGAGGAGPNVLADGNNGDLEAKSRIDARGQEVNRLPLWDKDRGFSRAFVVRIPQPNQTLNGVTFGSAVGGAILGGGADSGSPFVDVAFDTGNLTYYYGSGGVFSAADYRNGNLTKIIETLEPTNNPAQFRYNMWINDPTGAPDVTGLTPALPDGDKAYPRIGGIGKTVISGPLRGFLFGLVYLPGPIFNDEAARTTAFAWLTERSA